MGVNQVPSYNIDGQERLSIKSEEACDVLNINKVKLSVDKTTSAYEFL